MEWLCGSGGMHRADSLADAEVLGLVMGWLYSPIALDFLAEIRSAVPSTLPPPSTPLSPPQTLHSCPLGLQPCVPRGSSLRGGLGSSSPH